MNEITVEWEADFYKGFSLPKDLEVVLTPTKQFMTLNGRTMVEVIVTANEPHWFYSFGLAVGSQLYQYMLLTDWKAGKKFKP